MLRIEAGSIISKKFIFGKTARLFLAGSAMFGSGCASGVITPASSPDNATSISQSIPLSTSTKEPTIILLTPTVPPTILPSATPEPTATVPPIPTILIPRTPTRIPTLTPPEATIVTVSQIWQDYAWFPISPDKAKREGLATLEESLGKFDKLAKYLLGSESHFQSQYDNFAADYLRKYPQSADWAGYCHGLAHAEILDPQPLMAPETFTLANGEKITVTYQDRLAFEVALHSGDAMLRFSKSKEENLDILIDGLIKKSQFFVVEAPALGLLGLWYRGVAAVSPDGSKLYVTGFNKDKKLEAIDRNSVRDAYIPVTRTDIAAGKVPAGLLEAVPDNWSYPLPVPLINRLVYGK